MNETIHTRAEVDEHYADYHAIRIRNSIELLKRNGATRVIELGGHPWAMTRELHASGIEVAATVSAEEVLLWPDELTPTRSSVRVEADGGEIFDFVNYSANLERTLFKVDEAADAVIACEIIEHCSRSPHIMLLNINHWLPPGGLVLITTPNGVQFNNPLRRKPAMPAFRADFYERHRYLFSMAQLIDLLELCGFEILERQFENPYRRTGLSRVYDILASLPMAWFREKFGFNLTVLARKVESRDQLDRVPNCYHPSDSWEHIRASEASLS